MPTKPTLSSVELNLGYTAWSSSYVDTVLHNNFYTIRPTLEYLRSNKEELPGGKEWRVPLWDGIEPVGSWYSRADTFSWTDVDQGLMAVYYPVQVFEPCVILSVDEDTYEGLPAKVGFVKSKVDNMHERLARKLNTALYTASPASNAVGSLPQAIASSGTYGNVDPTVDTWWVSTAQSSFSFASSGITKCRSMWTLLTKWSNVGEPDTVLCDSTIWEAAQAAGFAHMTVYGSTGQNATNDVNLNSKNIGFNTAKFVYDPDCTSGGAYWMNKKAISLVERSGKGLSMEPWVDLRPAGIPGRGTREIWMGQLVDKSRAGLGKWSSVTA